jgi:O-antigen/teichoic acid export membrane protein
MWTLCLQVVVKLAAFAASLALGMLLSPEEFGLAGFAISASSYVMILNIWCFGDLLCAAPRRVAAVAAQLQFLSLACAALQAALVLALGWILSIAYPERPGLFALLGIIALRPLSDAFCVVPLSRMRTELRFRATTLIELCAGLFGSGVSVSMARFGAGAASVVFAPVSTLLLRIAIVWRGTLDLLRQPPRPRTWRPIMRGFMVLSSGSYVYGILILVETSILGLMAPDRAVGLFVFAFGLATQLNGIIGQQVAGTIQPIMGHIRGDSARQSAGLLRANRLLAAILVPALLVQAVSTARLFEIAWPGRWSDAVLLHQVLSIGQLGVIFTGSSQHMLKGQGRFTTFTTISAANLVACLVLLPPSAAFGGPLASGLMESLGLRCPEGIEGPLAVAIAGSAIRFAFGIWMLRTVGGPGFASWRQQFALYAVPVVASLPAAYATWLALESLLSPAMGRLAQAMVLLVVCAAGWATGSAACVLSHASTRRDAREIAQRLLGRLVRRAPPA